jgi:hypothetical protein
VKDADSSCFDPNAKKENFLLRRKLTVNKTFSAGQNLALELK